MSRPISRFSPRLSLFLQDIHSGILVFERYETTSIHWHIYQDVAIATGTIEATAYRSGNEVPSSRFRFTRIFVRKGDAWQVLLFHNTILSGPALSVRVACTRLMKLR